MEPKKGIEPSSPGYESGALPLSYFGVVHPEGFEPPTSWFEANHSVH